MIANDGRKGVLEARERASVSESAAQEHRHAFDSAASSGAMLTIPVRGGYE